MTSDNFSHKGCDARDLAVLWPCGAQTGFVPIPQVDQTFAGRRSDAPDQETV